MASDRIVLRRKDSGAGVVFKTRKEADAYLKANKDYSEEVETKAVEPTENKAVKPAENKAR